METKLTNSKISQQIQKIHIIKTIKGLKVPLKQTNFYHKKIKAINKIYEVPNMDKIRSEGDKKIILVNDGFKIQDLSLNQYQIGEIQVVDCQVELNFNHLSNQQIFNLFLKLENWENAIPFPNSFQTVGHIAHYNLTSEQEKFKEVIGEITLAKCLNIKTVVNKTEKLHNIYRTPILQYMSGEKNYLVKMKEVGVNFEFDFQKVYWCSRLQQQRDRILQYIKQKQCVVDLFCGVGPLAIRAAKKGAYVIANDLNPSCYQYLVNNSKINGVQGRMMCWNMCARQAIRKIIKQHCSFQPYFQVPDHFYMNLPVDAIQFLDQFKQYGQKINIQKMPIIHINCFVVVDSDQKCIQILIKRINKVLNGFKKQHIICLHHIKNVTVIMRMYCLSFQLMNKYDEPSPSKQQEEQQIIDRVQKKIKYN